MIEYKEITTTKERESLYPYRHVNLPRLTKAPFGTRDHEEWMIANHWMIDYFVFMNDKPEALRLAQELDQLFKQDPDDPRIHVVVDKIKSLQATKAGKRTALETWANNAYQLVNFAGDREVWEVIIAALDKYKGTILEAMCGHSTYFIKEKSDRKVTALDYCIESLERYTRPARRRICCDLNQVRFGEKLSFFDDNQFDVISICFGFKYPTHIAHLLTEFRRILKPGGTLSFIENPGHGYPELCRRTFDEVKIVKLLKLCGFNSAKCYKLEMPQSDFHPDRDNFYHTQATK